MCGISALYRFTEFSQDDYLRLEQMNREMYYRGPNENGVWHDNICGLAHTRLSIIGLTNGHQPIYNEQKTLVLVCNGEIYNYKQLKVDLQTKGHVFSTESDSEVILHLYEEYAEKSLDYLQGMFAFALWNIETKQLFVARDRIGEKTLYFSQMPTGIVFSTELKAILKYYIDKPQINPQPLAETIRYNFPIELRETFIQQVKRLKAGEYAVVDQQGLTLRMYWKRDLSPTFQGTIEEAKNGIVQLMRQSVANCMQSDVPVAVLLSGGIDSSAIAAMAKDCTDEVHVITAGYKGHFDCDEREVAQRFAKEKGLIYHEVELSVDDFKKNFDEYVAYLDEPVADVASMSQWALYKKAKELGFTVLLGGIGGDELFYGYPYHNQLAAAYQLKNQHLELFPWKGMDKKKAFLRFILKNWKSVLFSGYPMKLDDSIPVAWTYKDYTQFAQTGKLFIWGDIVNFSDIDVHYTFSQKANEDTIYEFVFSRFMTTLCLYLADRLGMGNSVEIRSPLVDYKLVEYVSSLPLHMKYKDSIPKFFLKDALKGIVPDYILYARKRGFTPPLDYIREMNREYQYQYFNSNHVFFNSMLADALLKNLLR